MRSRAFFASGLFLASFLVGCGSSGVLGTVGNEAITLSEFEEMYAKNNGGWEKASQSSLEDRERFLDLLVKYRLKLLEAANQALMEDPEIREELLGYQKTVATTFIIEKELIEPSLRRLYQRKTEELRASHILVRVAQTASPDDTLQAYLKAKALLALGEKLGFDSVAATYSEDPGSAQNAGDLGWFSQGRMVTEFEDAAYALRVGEITLEPVRTQFGYHLIKLTGRRPNKGSVRVSHILRRYDQTRTDSAAVRDSVTLAYALIRSGSLTFEEAVRRFSDDPSSVGRGGDIGVYEFGTIPQDISTILHATAVDSITSPYRAEYGYHIFKVTEIRPLPPYSTLEKDLRTLYQQRYYTQEYESFLHDLKRSYNLSFNVKLRREFTNSFPSEKTLADSDWAETISPAMAAEVLFTLGGKSYTVGDIVKRLNAGDEFRSFALEPQRIDDMIDRITDAIILEEHASTVGQRHPSFARLMEEYERGILIYQIDQNEIWKKVVVSDSLLREYHARNAEKYRWPYRINIGEIHLRNDSLAAEAYERLQRGEDFGDVAEEMTARPGFREQRGEWGFLPVATNQLATLGVSMLGDSVSAPFEYEGGWSIIKVLGRDKARQKTFEEALPEVTSHFQEEAAKRREAEWIDTLRKKYGVSLDREKLSHAFIDRESQ